MLPAWQSPQTHQAGLLAVVHIHCCRLALRLQLRQALPDLLQLILQLPLLLPEPACILLQRCYVGCLLAGGGDTLLDLSLVLLQALGDLVECVGDTQVLLL